MDASLFTGFDYVALGHIHKPQQIGNHPVWYAGSPLKYSFGEATQVKGALLVTMGEKGLESVQNLSLNPLHDFRKIKGSLKELLEQGQRAGEERFDYLQAILTDTGELIDPIGTLRSVYPNIMQIIREEREFAVNSDNLPDADARNLSERKDALTLFEDFYRQVRGQELCDEGRKIVAELVKELEG